MTPKSGKTIFWAILIGAALVTALVWCLIPAEDPVLKQLHMMYEEPVKITSEKDLPGGQPGEKAVTFDLWKVDHWEHFVSEYKTGSGHGILYTKYDLSRIPQVSLHLPNAEWRQTNPPASVAKWAAENQSKTKIVHVAAPGSRHTGDSVRNGQEFETAFLQAVHGKEIKRGEIEIDGRVAYRFVAESSFNGIKRSYVVVYVLSDGQPYIVNGLSLVGDADTDPEINATIKTFHLVAPPSPTSGE